MKNPTLRALQKIDAGDHAAAWALVRGAELHVPAMLSEGDGDGHFITIEASTISLVVALTHPSRKPPAFAPTDATLRMTGRELAIRIPKDTAIIVDPGHDDARVFLPECFASDREDASAAFVNQLGSGDSG